MTEQFFIAMQAGEEATKRATFSTNAEVRSLTEAIVRGDEETFNLFYQEYSPRVFRFLIVITGGDEDLSSEIHQCVMITAAQKLKVFRTERELWGWLAQVARNKCRDLWRKNGRHTKALECLAQVLQKDSDETSTQVAQSLLELSPADRELVESFYFEALSQKEMSRSSGRSIKAIQCALARVRRRIQHLLRGNQ